MLGNAELFMEFDISGRLAGIRCPCLVLHGNGDVVCPLDPCGTGLRDALPDVSLEVLEGVNHCPMTEDPKRTNELIARFLDEQVRF